MVSLALFELLEAVEFTPSNETQSSEEGSTSATMSVVTAPAVEATAEGEVPMVSTPAGPMPGILILRQNKKRKATPLFILYAITHNIFIPLQPRKREIKLLL